MRQDKVFRALTPSSVLPESIVICLKNVTKRYGAITAVDQVSFAIGRGEAVGFLGPNGAGKSTVLKMISTWLPPSEGGVEVMGHDVQREALAVRRLMGYLPEHNALYENMRVDRYLSFAGRMHGLKKLLLQERLDWAAEKCELKSVLLKRVHQCSKGFRQRIGLAAALVHDPQILLLDEPTHGLDPIQVLAFRGFIQELRPNRAILFSSHILSEVMAICNRVLIIRQGRLLADATVQELNQRAAAQGVDVEQMLQEIVRAGANQ